MQESVGPILHKKALMYAGVSRVYPPLKGLLILRESVGPLLHNKALINAGVGH